MRRFYISKCSGWWVCLLLLCFFTSISSISHSLIFPQMIKNQYQLYDVIDSYSELISNGDSIEQMIELDKDVYSVSFQVATFTKKLTEGCLEVSFIPYDETESIASDEIETEEIIDNGWVTANIFLTPGTYKMIIEPKELDIPALVVYTAEDTESLGRVYSYNNVAQDKSIAISIGVYEERTLISAIAVIVAITTGVGLLLRKNKTIWIMQIISVVANTIMIALGSAFIALRNLFLLVVVIQIALMIIGCDLKSTLTEIVKCCQTKKENRILCRILLSATVFLLLSVGMLYDGNITVAKYRLIFVLGAAFAIINLIVYRKKSVEYLFIVISLTTGIVFATTLPITTNVSWDDQIHYQRALEYIGTFTEADLSMSRLTYPKVYDMDTISCNIRDMDLDYEMGVAYVPAYRAVSVYNAIGYAPLILGVLMGRILHLPFHIIFILGRLAHSVFYSIVVFCAIKITPVGKRILTVVGLLPTSVFLAANYSYDPWVTSMTMLWVAMLFRTYVDDEESLTLKRFLIMLLIYVLACGPKAIYFPLGCMFLLLIWKRVVREKRVKYYASLLMAAMCGIYATFAPFIINFETHGDKRGAADVSSAGQVAYILQNPLEFIQTLFKHVINYISLGASEDYMTLLAYMGHTSHFLILLLLLWMTVFIDRNENDRILLKSYPNRSLVLLMMFCMVCLISASLYVSFTPVAADYIAGTQLRYLLPLVFPTLVFLGSSHIENHIPEQGFNMAISLLSSSILFHGIWETCISKYIV